MPRVLELLKTCFLVLLNLTKCEGHKVESAFLFCSAKNNEHALRNGELGLSRPKRHTVNFWHMGCKTIVFPFIGNILDLGM